MDVAVVALIVAVGVAMVNLLGTVGWSIIVVASRAAGVDHHQNNNKTRTDNETSNSNHDHDDDDDAIKNDKNPTAPFKEESSGKKLIPSLAPLSPPPPPAAAAFLRLTWRWCLLSCVGFLMLFCVLVFAWSVVNFSAVVIHKRLQFYQRHYQQSLPVTDCRVLSRDVGLRRVRLCSRGSPSLRRRVLERVVGKSHVRVKQPCYFHYYWTCIFQLEFKPKRSSMPVRVEVDAPGSLLPLHCRPDFDDAWNTKERYRVNDTYPCTYNPRDLRQVDIALKEAFRTCKVDLEDDGDDDDDDKERDDEGEAGEGEKNGYGYRGGGGDGPLARIGDEIAHAALLPWLRGLRAWMDFFYREFQGEGGVMWTTTTTSGGGPVGTGGGTATTMLMLAGLHILKVMVRGYIFGIAIAMTYRMIPRLNNRLLLLLHSPTTLRLSKWRRIGDGGHGGSASSSYTTVVDAAIGIGEKSCNSTKSSSSSSINSNKSRNNRIISSAESPEATTSLLAPTTFSSSSSSSSSSSPSSSSSSSNSRGQDKNDHRKHNHHQQLSFLPPQQEQAAGKGNDDDDDQAAAAAEEEKSPRGIPIPIKIPPPPPSPLPEQLLRWLSMPKGIQEISGSVS